MARPTIKTIGELEALYYGGYGSGWIRPDAINHPFIMKADAPVTTSTTGVYNAVYGAQVWHQINREANAFGLLPKIPFGRSGARLLTARAVSPPSGGQAETGTIPDTIKPTYLEMSTKPKIVAHAFDNTMIQEYVATQGGDDAYGAIAHLRQDMAVEHKEQINAMLLQDVDVLPSNNFESIDRVVSSYAEVTNCGITAGDSDIYGNDRDAAASAIDAYVNHNSNVDRDLTDLVVRTVFRNVQNNGGNPQFWLTGHDTHAAAVGLYDTQVRYDVVGQTKAKVTLNGVDTHEGIDVGIKVTTLYGWPVFISKNAFVDTISRLYLLDTSNPEGYDTPRMSMKIAMPTMYYEAGANVGTLQTLNKFGNEGMYVTMGELWCTFFAAQGKARDLK